jgi:hypothetical protein
MEQSKKRSGSDGSLQRKPAAGRRANTFFFVALGAAVLLALFLLWWIDPGQRGNDLQRLVGHWERGDNQVLDVLAIHADGTVEVRYFNPDPVDSVTARASMEDGFPSLFVELSDPNYKGSTYTLTYNPAVDELTGVFFQAVEQQVYDVAFKRKGPPAQ